MGHIQKYEQTTKMGGCKNSRIVLCCLEEGHKVVESSQGSTCNIDKCLKKHIECYIVPTRKMN